MEQNIEYATSNVKNTEPNTSNDINFAKEPILSTPIPNVIMLGLFFVSILAIIISGYIHGHMNISAVYKNLQ